MPIESPRGRAARSEPNATGRLPRPVDRRPGTVSGTSQGEHDPTAFTDGKTAAGHLPSWVDGDLETPPSAEAIELGDAPASARNPFEDDRDTDTHPRCEEAAAHTPALAAPTSRVPFRALAVEPQIDASADLLAGETVANVPVPALPSLKNERRGNASSLAEDASDVALRSMHSPAALFEGEPSSEASHSPMYANAPGRTLVTQVPPANPATRGDGEDAAVGPAQVANEGAAREHSDDFVESGPPMLTRWQVGPSRALRPGPRAMHLGGGAPGDVTNPRSSPPAVTDVDAGTDLSSVTKSSVTPDPAASTAYDGDVAESPWPRELGVELDRARTMLRSLSQFGAYLDEAPREEFARRMLAVHQCLQSAAALLPRINNEHDDDGEDEV